MLNIIYIYIFEIKLSYFTDRGADEKITIVYILSEPPLMHFTSTVSPTRKTP